MASRLTITHLSHDLAARKSFVSYVWESDPARRLGVEVPFGTALADVEPAARKALDALAAELQTASLSMP